MMKLKSRKGITLISLAITVVVMVIIISAMIFNAQNHAAIKKINDLYADIQVLNAKVEEYFIKYGELPVLEKYKGEVDGRAFYDYIAQKAVVRKFKTKYYSKRC